MLRLLLAATLAVTAAPSAAPPSWDWPASPVRVVEPYVAPAHAYAPGHRGIDVAAIGTVRAPDDGVVAFVGTVVDRPVLTIDHGGGVVSTLEPVRSELSSGAAVTRGQTVGVVVGGGHAPPGTLHLGARVDGAYVNPLRFLGGVPRAVLLPCC
ncbi:peptidoglycan DD-metalloendopeptidase family protein [Microbacterium sp. RD1]|uniref:peptidoglycan DD-metalloendopeptidase family protein n=1 Tax=Microbacterium sp. RD1 TaxID=3457313 RepID=UPI003FA57C54